MDIDFELRGSPGRVSVTYARNDRPELVGSGPQAAGFPWCHASVEHPAQGYDAVLGWVQLVRSDDNASGGRAFEIDPLDFLGDLPHPFCWLGLRPQLFDAPSRQLRRDLDWEAHSFLCVPDGDGDGGYEVHALLGFAWGFRIRGEVVELVEPTVLGPAHWTEAVAVLAAGFPAWRFMSGFRSP